MIHVFLHDARLLDPHQWEHYWRFPNRPLLTALCQAAVRKMQIFNAQHMANMTWAMATLAHKARSGIWTIKTWGKHGVEHEDQGGTLKDGMGLVNIGYGDHNELITTSWGVVRWGWSS